MEFGNYVLDVLGQFGGGRGESENDYVRFGLGILLFGTLLVWAWRKRARDRQQRDTFLVVGFAFGLGRESLMFVVKSLQISGVVDAATLELFFPPLEHSLLAIARVTIAAAFINYLLQSPTIARRYLAIGVVAILAFYLVAGPIWWARVAADPDIRFSKFLGDWVIHGLGAGLSLATIAIFTTARNATRYIVIAAFLFIFLDDALMLANLATGEVAKMVLTPIRHNLHIWAIVILAYIYWREQQLETARLEKQLQQSERMQAVGQLAAGVAHDFNNLLQVIVGFTDLARGQKTTDHDALNEITMASDRAALLVDQLLTFSRQDTTEAGQCEADRVVRGMLPMVGQLLGSEIALRLELNAADLQVPVTTGRVEQILTNLLVNARDAMPDGGEIVIRTKVTGPVLRDPESAPLLLHLSVSDTGTGMAAEVAEHAFEPFYTGKPVGQGTGLGLATVFGIVDRHNGKVTIDSTPGRGTTVHVRLPARRMAPQAAQEAAIPDPPRPAAGGRATILVAEDEPQVMGLITKILTRAGYQVIGAADGRRAVEAALSSRQDIDLFLFDIAMPKLNGYQAHDELVGHGRTTPALFMSGNTYRAGRKRAGAPHIGKPFSKAELLEKIRQCLSGEHPGTVTDAAASPVRCAPDAADAP